MPVFANAKGDILNFEANLINQIFKFKAKILHDFLWKHCLSFEQLIVIITIYYNFKFTFRFTILWCLKLIHH
jgi:hypothetical protein